MCGELPGHSGASSASSGSSPRVRGTPGFRAPPRPGRPVHPRVCGELPIRRDFSHTFSGSSPRVRGTLTRGWVDAAHWRFIPACAGNSPARRGIVSARPVHPRVCGELDGGERAALAATGSSPRVRGTQRRTFAADGQRRFIPACAGNSGLAGAVRRDRPVHPRVCGELSSAPDMEAPPFGSSPRVRGTREGSGGERRGGRFIPACAGNSRPTPRTTATGPVHPRVCGELMSADRSSSPYSGSSPRVRGTRVHGRAQAGARRFIPACAGNSGGFKHTARVGSVHPRVCGELAIVGRLRHAVRGSSPRVRGTLARIIPGCARRQVHPRVCGELPRGADGARHRHRFIPACAGNSRSPAWAATSPAVHPRVCGELGAEQLAVKQRRGSSPRVRGTRANAGEQSVEARFIPACAGNSLRARTTLSPSTVHPRVCGELLLSPLSSDFAIGSSPRVRGTRRVARHGRGRGRFIPACAGNSSSSRSPSTATTVHPRVCGELAGSAPCTATLVGSSPRVRGTRTRTR